MPQRLLTTAELAQLRGVTPQAISAQVRRKTLKPAQILANGQYLFRRDQVS